MEERYKNSVRSGFIWLRIGSCGKDKEVINLWVLQAMRISQPREKPLTSALWLYFVELHYLTGSN